MKKIMCAMAVIALVGVVQAATIKWNVNNIYQYDSATGKSSTEKALSGTYYVMCFMESDSAGKESKLLSMSDAIDYAKNGNFTALNEKVIYEGALTAKGAFSSSKLDLGWNGDDTVKLYALVFDGTPVNGAKHVSYAEASTPWKFTDASQEKTLSITQANNTWAAVQSVPEPTSGLLLLLGIAGMALRRKRK